MNLDVFLSTFIVSISFVLMYVRKFFNSIQAKIFQSVLAASEVTEVSGRGMGMDIVASTIKGLRGSIELDSVVGEGTCFTIQLPPSMSILASLLIEVGDTMFALPLTEVREIVELTDGRVQTVQTRPVLVVREQPMPFVLLPQTYRFADGVLAGEAKGKTTTTTTTTTTNPICPSSSTSLSVRKNLDSEQPCNV